MGAALAYFAAHNWEAKSFGLNKGGAEKVQGRTAPPYSAENMVAAKALHGSDKPLGMLM